MLIIFVSPHLKHPSRIEKFELVIMTNDTVSTSTTSIPAAIDDVRKPNMVVEAQKSSLLSLASPENSLRRLMTSASPLKSARFSSSYSLDLDRYKRKALESASQTSPDQQEQQQSEAIDLYGYGYGYGPDEAAAQIPQLEDGVNKRRRFERRNSKTPAMLMRMNPSLLFHLDFLEDKKEFEGRPTSPRSPTTTSSSPPSSPPRVQLEPRSPTTPGSMGAMLPSFDSWDGGLEIAEDLVFQLQKRKRSGSTALSPVKP